VRFDFVRKNWEIGVKKHKQTRRLEQTWNINNDVYLKSFLLNFRI